MCKKIIYDRRVRENVSKNENVVPYQKLDSMWKKTRSSLHYFVFLELYTDVSNVENANIASNILEEKNW